MTLTKYMLLRRNIRCAFICAIKAKYVINKIYVIHAKYKMQSSLCHKGEI